MLAAVPRMLTLEEEAVEADNRNALLEETLDLCPKRRTTQAVCCKRAGGGEAGGGEAGGEEAGCEEAGG